MQRGGTDTASLQRCIAKDGNDDIDRGTGDVKVRRFVAVDDCGNIINPMIVEGQIRGGLTQGIGPALYEEISYEEEGNISGGSFLDY